MSTSCFFEFWFLLRHFWVHSTMELLLNARCACVLVAVSAVLLIMPANAKEVLWKTTKFEIPAGEGRPKINIVPHMIHPDGMHLLDADGEYDEFQELNFHRRPTLIFPADVYPPHWKDREIIEKAFQLAAKEAGFPLNHDGTESERNCSKFVCQQGRPYNPNNKNASDIQKKVFQPMEEEEKWVQKEGLIQDRFVNKVLAQQTNPNKQNHTRKGFTGASRAFTQQPDNEHLCPFCIRLQLKPGKYWFVAPGTGFCGHACEKRDPENIRAKVRDMDAETVKVAGTIAHHATCGQARSMLYDLTKENYSNTQVRNIRLKYGKQHGLILPMILGEDAGENSELSDAAQLIQYLEAQQNDSSSERKSYIAYYHHLTDTTLLTVRQSDLRRDRERRAQEKHDVQSKADKLNAQDSNNDGEVGVIEIEMEASESSGYYTRSKAQLTAQERTELVKLLNPVHNQLKVGQKILLAVAWVRDDERRLFQLHPRISCSM